MYEGLIHSLLIERFAKGTKKNITDGSDQNKPLISLVINYILNYIDHKWVGSDTYQESKRELLMTASCIYVEYGYSLKGCEGFCVESQQWWMEFIWENMIGGSLTCWWQ